MKKNLLKSMLVALMVMVGGSAWADNYFSQNYEADGATADWKTSVSGRFDPIIASDDDGNHYLAADPATTYNNGATLTSNSLNVADSVKEFTMLVDLRVGSANNGTPVFTIKNAAGNAIFTLANSAKSSTKWKINDDNEIDLPNTGYKNASTVNDRPWYRFQISFKNGLTYVTVIDVQNSTNIADRFVAKTLNTAGGVGTMTFATAKSLAKFAIDNITVRDIQDGDVPAAVATSYTIKYTDGNGATIKDNVVVSSIAGIEVTASNDQIANFIEGDKKYIYVSGNQTITTVADSASNVITLVFREAATWNYAVKSSLGTTIKAGTAFEQDAITYYYPQYELKGDTLYEAAKSGTNPYYGKTFTLTSDNQEISVSYTTTGIGSVVFYKEAELIEGAISSSASNADIRCSTGAGAYFENANTIVKLPAGKYKMAGQVWGGAGTTFNATAKGNDIWSLTTTGSLAADKIEEATEFELTGNTDIIIPQAGNANRVLDYVIIKKTGDYVITPAYGTIWEDGETTIDTNENTIAEIAAAYFNNFAKANDTIRATVVVAAPARTAGPARIIATGNLSVFAGMSLIYEAANIPVGESKLDIALDNEDLAAIAEAGSLKFVYSNLTLKKVELVEGAVDPAAIAAAKEALQTAIAIASNINPEGLVEAIAAAQAVLTNEDATLLQIIQATQALETAIKSYFEAVLPRLGAIVGGLNDSTLNAAYADAQAALAKEDVTPQELAAAMQKIIVVAQAVAPEHLNNLKGYAVKYGAEEAVALVDSALVAINEGNVAKIIATMAAVKEAATPFAKQVLGRIIEYVKAFGLTEQAAQAQAALESDNYVTMITVAKALFNHLIAAAKDYLPKLAIIAEGLNDSTLSVAYAEADTLLAKESITPEELGAAMQKIIVAAKAVAPAHLQNLRAYALKYGQEGTAALVDSALVAIEEGNVSKIIATMTAVREAATPLATNILTQLVGYAQNYDGFEEDVTEAQAVLRGGNYITMITTAKALYAKLIAAAKAYVTKVKAIPTEGKEGVEDLNTAINAAELALAAEDSDFSAINTAITNLIAAVKAFTKANYFIDFAAGQYYIIDAESGKFMAAGHNYGTRGIVNTIGLDLTITPNTESRMVTIDSRVANSATNHFLGTNLYMDAPTTEWALEYQGFGFWITDGTKYISIDENDNLVMSETPREWIIVSSEGVKATRMDELAEATKDAPKDATWAIQCANFNRNDQRISAWEVSEDCTNKNLSGGSDDNRCAESYHSTFTISQTIKVPKGVYALTAQGFYRQDDNATEDAPVFFANAETGAIPVKAGNENSMTDASASFSAGNYTINPIYVEVGADSTLKVGIKGTATHQWVIWDNFQLKYYGSEVSIDEIKNAAIYAEMLALREQLKNIKNEVEIQVIKDSIDNVLNSTENPEGAEAINATVASLKAVLEVAQAYVKAKSVLPSMKQLTEETNFYTAEALQSYYTQWNEKYQAGTLTKDEANALQDPFLGTGWHSDISYDDLLLSVWSIGGEKANNYDKALYINTWSIEGNNDGSDFKVPFFEYWTGDGESLGANTLTGELTGLEKGHYQVGIRVRVRVKNAAQAPATGITMNVNDETAVDVCAGTQVGETQFYMGEFTAEGDVFEEGVLKLNINVAAENNISWLSFKDAMYTRVGETVGIAGVKSVNKLDGTIYNLNGQKMDKAQKGLYIINGKKVVVK